MVTLRFDFLGVLCSVEVYDPLITEWLNHLFWRFRVDGPFDEPHTSFSLDESKDGYRLLVDKVEARSQMTREEAAMRLIVELNRQTVSRLEGFAVHAGAVSGPDGAVIFPGGPGSGKSTLVAAAGLAGFRYVTDEIALFGTNGCIRPFPKPLWLASWSRDLLGIDDTQLQFVAPGLKAAVAPEDLRVRVASQDMQISHVVMIERSDKRSYIAETTLAEAAKELITNSYHLEDRGESAFTSAAEAVRQATVLRCKVHDPIEAAGLLARLLKGDRTLDR